MTYRIGLLEGDFIGPEIIRQAVKVLKACAARFSYDFELIHLPVSGEAYDLYGEPLPQSTIDGAKSCHALLKGPFGGPAEELNHPKWAGVETRALLPLRKIFNLYTNLRETKIYPPLVNLSPLKPEYLRGVNILIVRELVSGIYFGEKGERTIGGERQFYDVESYSESEIARIAKTAFELARARRGKVTLVAKSNVLKSSVLWREVTEEVRGGFPDVTFDYLHVDNAAMQCVLNPAQFDVILTSNMFGDILSDEVSVLSGSIGLFPSASLNGTDFGLYEPIHGSAPAIAGQNIANPLSAILCVPLLFTHTIHDAAAAKAVEDAVERVLEEGYRTKDLFREGDDPRKLLGTEELGDLLAGMIGE